VAMVTATEVSFLTMALYLLEFAIKVVALGLVPEGRRPSSATAWLLLILFLPVIGLVAFWLIGSPFVDRGRRRQQAAAGEVISAALTAETDDLLPVPAGSTLNTLVVLNRRLGWLPAVGGNEADLLSDYDESIAAMAGEVRTAERYVHVEFYIMSWDSTTNDFFEALAEVAARGVKVRLLFDHIGTARIPGYRDMIKKLEQTAIEWHPTLPIQPLKGKWRRPDLRKPSQDRRRRRPDGLCRLAQHDRRELSQPEARASRSQVARAGYEDQRACRVLYRHRLCHGLVPRNGRGAS
jgi:cardiolipin synthase